MMKYILTAALALTLLGGTAAMADPGNNGRGDRHENNGRNNKHDNKGHDRKDQGHDRNVQSDHRDRGNYTSRSSHDRNWSRGDRLPAQYRQKSNYVSDWRQHGLKQPPRGYHWVRNDNNDFFLTVIATGIIGDTMYRGVREQNWNRRYSRAYTYNDDNYYRECRNSSDPGGIIVGAVIGGLLGNAVGRDGNRGGSTLAGVVVGGAVGAALTNNLNCDDRSYAYRTYYDGFNAGRPNTTYRWDNPRNDHRGEFRIRNYYNDQSGFRCANYQQVIYGQGRKQKIRGKACRQPDGVWAIVS